MTPTLWQLLILPILGFLWAWEPLLTQYFKFILWQFHKGIQYIFIILILHFPLHLWIYPPIHPSLPSFFPPFIPPSNVIDHPL